MSASIVAGHAQRQVGGEAAGDAVLNATPSRPGAKLSMQQAKQAALHNKIPTKLARCYKAAIGRPLLENAH
jgi:hypothetical protein